MSEFAPEELEHSNRIFKSATPKYTLDWYIKWIASILILVSLTFRASGIEYHMWDMIFGWFGILGWTVVGYLWKDRAVIILNAVSLILLSSGILRAIS